MSERENLPRIERQLRLYEMVCQYVIVQFSAVCEIFPYNMRLLQRDLADLRDAGLVSVKYSKKGKGYVKTGVPEFNEKAKPCKKAHLKRLRRLGILMSEFMNCSLACRSGQARRILRCCEVLGTMFSTMRWNIVFIRMITVSLWGGLSRLRK